MFKRIGLFFLTNILVMLTISVAANLIITFFHLQGFSGYLPDLIIWCGVFGFGGALVSLFMSKFMAKHMMGVEVIDPKTMDPVLRPLVTKIHELARRAQLPEMPEVGIYESADINAFATGPSKRNSLVAVSTGLLNRMNDAELEGVLGHEITHIANGDMVTMTLIQGVVNTFAMVFSRLLASVIASNVEERSRYMVRFLVTMIGDILFTILGSLVVNYFSRRREFRADAGSARIAGKQKMILALQKLKSVYEIPLAAPSEEPKLATLKISHRPTGGISAFFMTHPSLDDRIEALQRSNIL